MEAVCELKGSSTIQSPAALAHIHMSSAPLVTKYLWKPPYQHDGVVAVGTYPGDHQFVWFLADIFSCGLAFHGNAKMVHLILRGAADCETS